MNITLCSAFRNSVRNGHLDRYLGQLTDLHLALSERGDRLYCVWGEGDSTDETLDRLTWAYPYARWAITIVDCTHGGQEFGSVEKSERFRQLAHVGRCIFAAIPTDTDAVVYAESDISWDAQTIISLIDRLADYPAISPMVLLDRKGWAKNAFYDTWGAIGLNGRHFEHHPPYNAGYKPDEPFPVSSMGSCMAMRGDIAMQIVIDERVFQGISAQIWAMGESVWIDPQLTCYHR